MLKIESKVGKIPVSDKTIYNFLSDFNNFENLLTEDKVRDYTSTEDSCSFTVDGIGKIGMKIIEKEPYKLIKVTGDETSSFKFLFWIQLKSMEEHYTRIKLTLHADINPMLQMVAKNPLQKFINLLIDELESYFQTKQ